jgi:hypothetical protein
MGLFTTRNGSPKPAKYFKAELSRAANDRLKLAVKLPQAEEQLAAAVAERRNLLTVESLNDSGIPRDKVDAARGRVEDIQFLLAELDSKINTLEIEYANAQARERRKAAIGELAPHVVRLGETLDRLKLVGVEMSMAATETCKRVPIANPNFGQHLSDLIGGVAINVTEVIVSARHHLEGLARGDAQPRTVEPPYVVPRPPEVKCISVVPIAHVRWTQRF